VDVGGFPIGLNGERVFTVDSLIYNQIDNCGGCGLECVRPNGFASCDRGTCELTSCRPGFLDVDGDPDNGCEQSDCQPDNVGVEAFESLGRLCRKPMYDDASECSCLGTSRCLLQGGVPTVKCVVDAGNPAEGDIVPPPQCPAAQRADVEVEQCDGLDNDCDGAADEDFVLSDPVNGGPARSNDGELIYNAVEHCGGCGVVCAPPFTLINACAAGACGIELCQDGRVDLNGEVEDGCEYACEFNGPEVCDATDNDCDGAFDEGLDGCAP
ncbi:MAG: Notch-like protein, partial [Bradymonadia bacterium]